MLAGVGAVGVVVRPHLASAGCRELQFLSVHVRECQIRYSLFNVLRLKLPSIQKDYACDKLSYTNSVIREIFGWAEI